ncbi:hypothetical protein [Undibacterium parvum]|uniref:DUF4398 domain-containing protein n=1 Tax=Undibacterium parvum TaxID=401471 RepID=A0A3Q9BR27_9BURK|nr:hypothetical protein [Undibacterium parvum]AZP12585.1 hypothetical protein EJN92_11565 [Undibacterium parvum]
MKISKFFASAGLSVLALMLSACASGPVTPDWQLTAAASLERSVAAYLSGSDRVADQEFARARSALASTGQATLVARAELMRCASQVSSLMFKDCPGFEALRVDAAAPELAYAAYLAGSAQPSDIVLLPEAQRSAYAASASAQLAKVAAIKDPFARLVAAGVLMRSGRADPALIGLAVDSAAGQGWRRPLLAWLTVQAMRAEKSGEQQEAQRLRRRMALVEQTSR